MECWGWRCCCKEWAETFRVLLCLLEAIRESGSLIRHMLWAGCGSEVWKLLNGTGH